MGSPENQLLPIFMKLIKLHVADNIHENLIKVFGNMMISPEVHNAVLMPQLEFLKTFKSYLQKENKKLIIRTLYNLCSYGTLKTIDLVLEFGILEIILNLLVNTADNNLYNISLLFVMSASVTPFGANIIRKSNILEFLTALLNDGNANSIKAAIIVANVYGKDENTAAVKALLHGKKSLLMGVLDIFAFSIHPPGTFQKKIHQVWKVPFSIIKLRDISSALKNLAISDDNKKVMMENQDQIFKYTYKTLNSYVNNDLPFHAMDDRNDLISSGGGGEDHLTIQYLLEFLAQLSFFYDDDEKLRASRFGEPEMKNILESFLQLPPERNFPYEAKQFVLTLLNRLTVTTHKTLTPPMMKVSSQLNTTELKGTEKNIDPITTTISYTQQHIMLSYAWGCKKENVIALGKQLRELGYDVWRDEEGSILLPSMSGDIADRMAEAVELSYMLVICVSPAYKESTNCRAEAKYALARQKHRELHIVYVMMEEGYHMKVDGWLGFMIGSELWYPLWSQDQAKSTADAIKGLIGDHAIASRNTRIELSSSLPKPVEESQQPVSSPLPPAPQQQVERDYEQAWNCLQEKKSIDPAVLVKTLDDMGVYDLTDFKGVPVSQFESLAVLLKPAPQNNFRKALGMTILE